MFAFHSSGREVHHNNRIYFTGSEELNRCESLGEVVIVKIVRQRLGIFATGRLKRPMRLSIPTATHGQHFNITSLQRFRLTEI